MGHYSMMMACQPEVDGFYHHNMCNLAGALYISNGHSWNVQWSDGGGEYPDLDSPLNRARMEVGAQGPVYRIIGSAFRTHPLLWHHGTSTEMDTTNCFYTSSKVMLDVYKYRAALKEKRAKSGLLGGGISVPGEVEWVALTGGKNNLCLVMVNTKQTAEKVKVTVPGKRFFAPTYRLVRIRDPKYIDCREVPGEAKLWEEFAFEDTQTGAEVLCMEPYEGLTPKCDVLDIEIGPNTMQSVTVNMCNAPKK